MSKIYFDKGSKLQFIEFIKLGKSGVQSLILIKKYYKYEPFLNFLPHVLSNIIMSYINDILTLEFTLHTFYKFISMYPFIECSTKIIINYTPIKINITYHFPNNKYEDLFNDDTSCYFHICNYNDFMKKYYGKIKYIENKCNDKCRNTTYSVNKRCKYEAIIIKKLHKILYGKFNTKKN